MAGTVTFTRVPFGTPTQSVVGEEFTINWTSTSGGAADLALKGLKGWLTFIKTNPGATAPTDDYDIKILDSESDDVLEGIGLNRDTTNSEFLPTAGSGILALREFNGDYTFDVTNAGNAKQGTCVLRFRF